MEILDCGHVASEHSEHTTGYGVHADGSKHCYACCAEQDKKTMRDTGRTVLYLSMSGDANTAHGTTLARPICGSYYYGQHRVTNWPGSLELPVHGIKVGRHNIAGRRYDFWFAFEGTQWHGVQYGDYTQIAHCKRLKSA
jgi:hypothetical protein